MSKLVVDQIQKSGGPALTLPTASGGANSLLANDGSGNLSFTTLGNLLPGGTTNTVLTNDGSGNLSFKTLAPVPADNPLIIGTVATSSARQNIYSTGEWTSSGPWTTYQNATAAGSNSTYTTQAWNMFLGDGNMTGTGTTENFFSHDYSGEYNREIHYAANGRVGDWEKTWFYYDNATSYGGVTWRVLPIRNTTGAAITTTVYFGYSSYDTYNGAACGYYTPTGTGTNYAAITGGTWTQGFSQTSNTITTSSMSVTVPANTTILVMLVTSHNYQTTYYFDDSNMFYNLPTTFSTGLVCDLRMLNTLAMARSPGASVSDSRPYLMYSACASIFGDR